MKATIILLALILFAAFMGCSDNVNLTDPSAQLSTENAQQKNKIDDGTPVPVWQFSELSVSASGETIAESKAVFNSPPFTEISRYMITFDVYTDAYDKGSPYTPDVTILKDDEKVYHSSEFLNSDGTVSGRVEVKMDYTRFTNLIFHIALSRVDDGQDNNDGTAYALNMSSIKVYRLD